MAERSPLLNPTPLKDSSVSTRVDGGKLVGATQSELVNGVVSAEHTATYDELDMPTGEASATIPEEGFGGFLGRSHGWDR